MVLDGLYAGRQLKLFVVGQGLVRFDLRRDRGQVREGVAQNVTEQAFQQEKEGREGSCL